MVGAVWRLARAVWHGLHGVAIVLLRFPSLPLAARRARIAWWSAKMLRMLGLQLQVSGTFKPGAKLIVANHVSWLDIMAIHAVCPEARFVSKADVQTWPLVNRLVDSAQTLYIQRENRRDALRVVHQMADALKAGDTVAVFPEGTTGPGPELLPFHANLLQAAIATGTPVQPVVLRFADRHGRFSTAAQYLGDTTLTQSLWRLAAGQGLVVHVTVLAAQGSEHADRRALSEHLRQLMADALAA
ncbi:MAG: 1-acyl-sn-glycerol-3-phosphate acyltransferase [Rubrivivax sp.]|nr:1-acyl-sn-glycerol-3-phosphate acyltransferase [Rubrivivax sp.]